MSPTRSFSFVTLGALATLACSMGAQEAVVSSAFESHDLDRSVQIGYGVAVADVDGDQRPDVLLADKKQFVWYRNPGPDAITGPWEKHVLAENLTARDNVCIAAEDIDGDGKCEIAVGAEWNPSDTEKSGAVFYLIAPEDRTKPWQPVRLAAEPTTHRMRWIRLRSGSESSHKDWGLVVAPLHGRGNKAGQGAGVKVLLYHAPDDLNSPAAQWRTELISDSMHMTHNFEVTHAAGTEAPSIMLAGREGLFRYTREGERWNEQHIVSTKTGGFLGAGEVRQGRLGNGEKFIAAVEPMHGTELTMYRLQGASPSRQVLLSTMADGHALACGRLSAGGDQIVVGYRGNPQQPRPVGIKLFEPMDPEGKQWTESWIDQNGMACEDLLLADLNGDQRLDIIASGRSTRNLKIYLNKATAQ